LEKEKIVIYRKVWKHGQHLVISIPKDIAEHYKLEGKFVKVEIEVLKSWK